jgi:membrane protease subunit (stomatin/prohibitin family)
MDILNQFKSVIQWDNPNEYELFIKFKDKGDAIKNASKLILQPGQGCVVTYEGKIVEVLLDEGVHDMKTGNKPFVTAIKKFLSLRDGSEHVLGIWFFRKADLLNMRWGTRVPISYTDPIYTFPILLSTFGNYSIRIIEPKSFFKNVIAGQEIYCHADLKEVLLSRIVQPITDYLANAKFSYVDIDSNLNTIAHEVLDKTRNIFENLGFKVLDFRIEGTMFDKETLDRIAKVSDVQSDIQAAKLAGIDYAEMQKLKAMRDAANNTGMAGVVMGMSAGMQAENSMQQSNQRTFNEPDDMQKLKKLKEIFELELITESEYNDKKSEILKRL